MPLNVSWNSELKLVSSLLHRRFIVAALLQAVVVVCLPQSVCGQAGDEGPLYMQPPFDRVVLKTGESVSVMPIRFPDGSRNAPAVMPAGGDLAVRLLDAKVATAEYSIPWTGIARIDLFEDMILQEAVRLSDAGEFDAAYPYYAHLLNKAPQTRRLDEAVARYLQANALAAFKAGEYDRSLAILGSLYERSPKANGLASAVDTVAGKIIEQYLQAKNYRAARMTLDVVAQTFKGLQVSVVSAWRQRFERAAAGQMAEAQRLANQGQYLAARTALAQAVGVWPELAGVKELQSRIQREHPVVTLGVLERSPAHPEQRLDSPASARAAALVSPTIVELRGYTAEGGEYQSSLGQLQLDPSGMELVFQLTDPQSTSPMDVSLASSALARQFLDAANLSSGTASPQLADLLKQVTVELPRDVRVQFHHPHVRPESLLTLPMSNELASASDRGRFEMAERLDDLIRFESQANREGAIAEVHERVYEDDDELLSALTQGTVDVVDRIPPWQVETLRAADGVVVDSYKLPSTHALVPTGRSPLTEQREFRRALCYGVDRDRFVNQVLLAGRATPGFQTVSGPFPAGIERGDPIRYGYNGQIEPRPYDPYMAIVLSNAAWNNVQKAAGVKEPGDAPMPTLKLGHSRDAVARTACTEIAKDLNAIGIPIEVVELSTEDMEKADELVDLKYVELSAWEPVSDARRLLGSEGVLGGASDVMRLALDRLDAARNWNDVRTRLYEIHDIASTDLPVIPLWQTVNYFAYRQELSGISPQPVQLFQNLADWQLEYKAERL